MKKIIKLTALAFCFTLISCATQKKWVDITNKVNTEEMMRENFSRLYNAYTNGNIIVDKIKQTTDENGVIRYRVIYKERSDSDWEDWLPILMTITI